VNSKQFAFENYAKVKNFGSTYSSISFDFIYLTYGRNPKLSIDEDPTGFRLLQDNFLNLKFAEIFGSLLNKKSCSLYQFILCIKATLNQPVFIFNRVIRI
jgi:hypothetical protein